MSLLVFCELECGCLNIVTNSSIIVRLCYIRGDDTQGGIFLVGIRQMVPMNGDFQVCKWLPLAIRSHFRLHSLNISVLGL